MPCCVFSSYFVFQTNTPVHSYVSVFSNSASNYMESMRPNKYGVIYSRHYWISSSLRRRKACLTGCRWSRWTSQSTGGARPPPGNSPSALKFQPSHRRAPPGLSLSSSSPPEEVLAARRCAALPACAIHAPGDGRSPVRRGIRATGILPVISPSFRAACPLHVHQPPPAAHGLLVSEEMENSSSSMQGTFLFCSSPTARRQESGLVGLHYQESD